MLLVRNRNVKKSNEVIGNNTGEFEGRLEGLDKREEGVACLRRSEVSPMELFV